MITKNEIRKFPLFELYVENDFLIINNRDYINDNGIIELSDIVEIELVKQPFDIIECIAAFFSGINTRKKSEKLQIKMRNGIKKILLTDCDIDKVEHLVNNINSKKIKKY